MRLSRYVTSSSKLVDPTSKRHPTRLLMVGSRGSLVLIDETTYQSICNDQLYLITPSNISKLHELGVLVDKSPQEELEEVRSASRQSDEHDRVYLLTVMPSSSCQMGCSYCGQSHGKGKLSSDLQEQLYIKLERQLLSGNYDTLNVSWYGGEPMLAFQDLLNMSKDLQGIAKKYNCIYQATITTNGLLLSPGKLELLVKKALVKVIQVTIDGTKEFHDEKRFTKAGKGTFESILKNLKDNLLLENLDFKIQIRCNVDQNNYRSVEELIDTIDRLDLKKIVNKFYTRQIFDWDNGADADSLSSEDYARIQTRWLQKLERLGIGTDLIPERTSGTCKVYNTDMMLTDPDGSLYKCYEYPLIASTSSRLEHQAGHLNDISIPGGLISTEQHQNRLHAEGHPCLACKVLPLCGGICEPHWERGMKKCPDFRINLPKRLDIYSESKLGLAVHT